MCPTPHWPLLGHSHPLSPEAVLTPMGSRLRKLAVPQWDWMPCSFGLGIISVLSASSPQSSHGYAETASGAQMSIKQPSLQVQKCFYNELQPPYWDPGETCCVCHFLVIRPRLQAPKISIPCLPSSGTESKCCNSCVYICFLWGRKRPRKSQNRLNHSSSFSYIRIQKQVRNACLFWMYNKGSELSC